MLFVTGLLLVVQAWSTSQGTIMTGGLYTAPANPSGQARVIFTHNGFRDTALVSFASSSAVAGIPFGPFSAWSGSSVVVGAPFTAGMGSTSPQYLPGLLANLETRGLRALISPFGGGAEAYLTNGVFDLAIWRAKLATYAPLVETVRAAYRRGQFRGLVVLDEPHNIKWGGGLTKAIVDQMCGEVRALFDVPAGVTHQHDLFSPSTPYQVCDFLVDQYVHRKTAGDAGRYRDEALAWTRQAGMAVVFSLNILDGGVQAARDGRWACDPALTAGRGTFDPNCQMTATQVRDWGLILGSAGCGMLMWRYEPDFMARTDNQLSFKTIADSLAKLPRKECVRP